MTEKRDIRRISRVREEKIIEEKEGHMGEEREGLQAGKSDKEKREDKRSTRHK